MSNQEDFVSVVKQASFACTLSFSKHEHSYSRPKSWCQESLLLHPNWAFSLLPLAKSSVTLGNFEEQGTVVC